MSFHHASCPGRSRRPRHGWPARAEDGPTTRRPARAAPASAAPSAPPTPLAPPDPLHPLLVRRPPRGARAPPRSDGSRGARRWWPARRCRPSAAPRPRASRAAEAASSAAGPGRGTPGARARPRTPQTRAPFPRRRAGLIGFAARTSGSPCRLLQDEPVQRQVRHRPAKAGALPLELFKAPGLVQLQAPELAPPPVTRHLVRRGLGPVAARASPPIERIASPSDVPRATITSTQPAAPPRPPQARAPSSASVPLRGLSRHYS